MSSTNTNTVIRMGNRKLLKQVFERCDCCPNIDFEHSPLFVLLETYAAIPPSKSGKLIHALQVDAVLFANKKFRVTKENAGFNGERAIAAPIGADGGERIIRTVGSPACIAKNRYGLPSEIPLSWQAFIEAYTKIEENHHE